MSIDDIRRGREVLPPDSLDQHRPRHHRPRIARQFKQQAELGLRQGQRLPAAPGHHARWADDDIACRHRIARLLAGPARPHERIEASVEFKRVRRFHDVIVGSRLQPPRPCQASGRAR
eukprot:GHVU01049006.1.p1 GENE.GHVU01049006.1~~GHVU01049006.1.p1  ORF type:complete len:118 (+),score=7.50 GHVU01049006.1:206-559(+)